MKLLYWRFFSIFCINVQSSQFLWMIVFRTLVDLILLFRGQYPIKQKLELAVGIHWIGYCVKSVRMRSYSGPNFPAFGLNTLSIVTLSKETFHAVGCLKFSLSVSKVQNRFSVKFRLIFHCRKNISNIFKNTKSG